MKATSTCLPVLHSKAATSSRTTSSSPGLTCPSCHQTTRSAARAPSGGSVSAAATRSTRDRRCGTAFSPFPTSLHLCPAEVGLVLVVDRDVALLAHPPDDRQLEQRDVDHLRQHPPPRLLRHRVPGVADELALYPVEERVEPEVGEAGAVLEAGALVEVEEHVGRVEFGPAAMEPGI